MVPWRPNYGQALCIIGRRLGRSSLADWHARAFTLLVSVRPICDTGDLREIYIDENFFHSLKLVSWTSSSTRKRRRVEATRHHWHQGQPNC